MVQHTVNMDPVAATVLLDKHRLPNAEAVDASR